MSARYSFFAGKGGVGKTTCAAAHALSLARAGSRTLVISTDPAHSLGDALMTRLGPAPRRVHGRLHAAEMNADRALSRFLRQRERSFRIIAARGTYLDDDDIDSLFRLSLPGVDELVALLELTRLGERFEEVVVDTAPTGHTLRLLQMPETLARLSQVLDDLQAKHRALLHSLRGRSRPDAQDAVIGELREKSAELHAMLRSPAAEFHCVLLAEDLPLAETRDALLALRSAGMRVVRLIANRLTPPPDRRCALCSTRRAEQARVLRDARALGVPLQPIFEEREEPRGLRKLQAIAAALTQPARLFGAAARTKKRGARAPASQEPWLEEIAPPAVRLLFFGGKGGVGKTTAAATAALAAARLGRNVLLLSTDPAHSLADVLATEIGDPGREVAERLWARELDARAAFAARKERYRAGVEELFATLRGGAAFDAPYDRAVIEDLIDLAPPGLDELFALVEVVAALERYQLVVVDTAPTGHALRLLQLVESAREWVQVLLQILLKYRSVIGLGPLARDLTQSARQLRELGTLLREAGQARFVAVTRAAELPWLETARLLASLRRLRLATPAVLINALTAPGCSHCTRAAAAEARIVARARRQRRGWAMLGAEAMAPPPRGALALEDFGRRWMRME